MKDTQLTEDTALEPPVNAGRRRAAFQVMAGLLLAVPALSIGGAALAEEFQRSRGRSNRRNRRCPTDPRWCGPSSGKR